MRIIGILLAGGESRRFGSPKAFAVFHNKPFYQVVLHQLNPVIDEAIIVTKANLLEKFNLETARNMKVMKDEEAFQGMGPLAGIYTGMTHTNGDYYFTVACDMPLVTEGLFSLLIEELNNHPTAVAVVPVSNGRRQPLCAIYHASCQPIIEQLLLTGRRRMNDLLESIDTLYVDVEKYKNQFLNVNTREEHNLVQKGDRLNG
ncbi:molybdenum cofactor guanylyltransferase [Bacillus sp. RAR_GA_16]|uniref:molybdenum cofactor guanylyltransferase n=1 Tax=Bacillus sp. RAR_GA_16 TaxID=2876774 RepID=UPI001CCC78B4|nr:molybdenum cofactor guanylyltransferase [Bacillus sp. RAR_GA_16]MCA0171058.1 molybdenum cofactor guanylyltransferase [Bacillus sp. RAR_GA_16]